MQQVISAKQAREICGNRTPLVPVEYETAVKALAECITLDEAKYWDNKADALAAWAKIYRSSEAERKAKLLKLHAYKRMGELAAEIRPHIRTAQGMKPGASSLLIEHGLTKSQATQARHLALHPEVLAKEIERPNPRSPSRLHKAWSSQSDPDWGAIRGCMSELSAKTFDKDPEVLARMLEGPAINSARLLAIRLGEWLDAFEQALPK